MSKRLPTIPDLQAILFQQIKEVEAGQTTAAKANAISNATGKILSTERSRMDYYRLSGRPLPQIDLFE